MRVLFLLLLVSLGLAPVAEAAPAARQGRFEVDKGKTSWTLHYTFSDESNKPRKLSVELPTSDESDELLRIRHSVSF